MNYPLISEYIEAIKSAEDNFKELTNLRTVLGDDGQPVMTSGNFAVVFKMEDIETGKLYALKCFTKEQEGRSNAYRKITQQLKMTPSSYLVPIRYLEKELFVDTNQTSETEFPVLQMDWVEGKTLDAYIRENIKNRIALETLSYSFYEFATWLISQPFAHGDLKPDNILIKEDKSLVIVDYDGMYVPAMNGQKAREIGSPDFRHPERNENDFNGTIDHFSIVSILLSLCIIHLKPEYYQKYSAEGRLLFCAEDYTNIKECKLYNHIPKIIFESTNYVKLLETLCEDKKYTLSNCMKHKQLTVLRKPTGEQRAIVEVVCNVSPNTVKSPSNIVPFNEPGKLITGEDYGVVQKRNEELRKQWKEKEIREEKREKLIFKCSHFLFFVIMTAGYIIGLIMDIVYLSGKKYEFSLEDITTLIVHFSIWIVLLHFWRLYYLYYKECV